MEYVARLRQLDQNLGTIRRRAKLDAHKKALAALSDPVGAMSSGAEEVDGSSIEDVLNTRITTASRKVRALLTVTEGADFLPKGAWVALIQSDSRIVFEADLATAGKVGLQVSAKMQQRARRVY